MIEPGDRFVLLGPNGAGKSTLVRVLSSLSRADKGACSVCGLDPVRDARQLMGVIGVVTQDNDLDPQASAKELLSFQCRLFGLSRRRSVARADELIDAMDLGEHAGKRVSALSGGNKRKLHCSLALVHRPRLLFLDEPTVGMDPEVRARFWESIRRINRDESTTLVLTTQYLEEAERHADQMALLYNGKIAYRGTVTSFVSGSGAKTEAKETFDGAFIPTVGRTSLEDGYLAYLAEVDNVAD